MQKIRDNNQNVLQKHVEFFDRNNDGVIYPWETFQGFRAIGSGIVLSSVAAIFINAGLSGKTRPVIYSGALYALIKPQTPLRGAL
ncbi:putative plant seed peroxygenase [Helianthus anomalus]